MNSSLGFSRFSSKSSSYVVKVEIPEFLSGVGKGVETHIAKLETEIGDFNKLLVTRTLKLKKLGIPCKHDGEAPTEEAKKSNHVTRKIEKRQQGRTLDPHIEKQFISLVSKDLVSHGFCCECCISIEIIKSVYM